MKVYFPRYPKLLTKTKALQASPEPRPVPMENCESLTLEVSMSKVQKLRDQSQETCTEWVWSRYRVGTELWGEAVNIALNQCKIHI